MVAVYCVVNIVLTLSCAIGKSRLVHLATGDSSDVWLRCHRGDFAPNEANVQGIQIRLVLPYNPGLNSWGVLKQLQVNQIHSK